MKTRVLILEPDIQAATLLENSVEGLRFSAHTASTLRAGLEMMDQADVLIIRDPLPNGKLDLALAHWSAAKGGPALVLSRPDLPAEEQAVLLRTGATHVLRTTDVATIQLLLIQYNRQVCNEKDIAVLKLQIRCLFWVVALESVLLCTLGGPALAGKLLGLVGGLL